MARKHRVKRPLADGSIRVYEYDRAHPKKPPKDSVASVIEEYQRSPDYLRLSPSTRKTYKRNLDLMHEAWGRLPVASLRRRDVLRTRDALASSGRSGRANEWVNVCGVIFGFAVDREYRDDNPALRVKRFAPNEYHRWPDALVDHAVATLPEPLARAVVLAVHTGQRAGDLVAMLWSDFDGEGVRVTQIKTGAKLWVPAHRDLKACLAEWSAGRNAVTILENSRGRPWSPTAFTPRFSQVIRKDPTFNGYVFHGLRKTAAARLAEAGCSVHEIAAITGHRTLAMISHYTAEADQKIRAVAAIRKLERKTRGKTPVK